MYVHESRYYTNFPLLILEPHILRLLVGIRCGAVLIESKTALMRRPICTRPDFVGRFTMHRGGVAQVVRATVS